MLSKVAWASSVEDQCIINTCPSHKATGAHQLLFEASFWWRPILSTAFWGIFQKKVHFIHCFLIYLLEKGPFYLVLIEVYFGNQFHPLLFRVSFRKGSSLSSAFWGIFWKSISSRASKKRCKGCQKFLLLYNKIMCCESCDRIKTKIQNKNKNFISVKQYTTQKEIYKQYLFVLQFSH